MNHMETMEGFYVVYTEKSFNTIIKELKKFGYEWVGSNKNLTFSECVKQIHGNAKLVVCAFYNNITHKKEIQFGTKGTYLSYPQFRGVSFINDFTYKEAKEQLKTYRENCPQYQFKIKKKRVKIA